MGDFMLFKLLRSAVEDLPLTEEEKSCCIKENLQNLLQLARLHDLAHLLALGLKKNGLFLEKKMEWEPEIFKAVYRYEQLNHTQLQLATAFSKAKIPFILLKGARLRRYYPEPYFRTSCDIDLLVQPKNLNQAQELLVKEYGFSMKAKGSHDISLFSKSDVHVELHYALAETERVKKAETLLNQAWSYAKPLTENSFEYVFNQPFFYFYHVAHMAKHFENGGCGIRPFLDLWMLNHAADFNTADCAPLLEASGLALFAKQATLLSEIWFGNAQHTKITKQIEDYILLGGVYGTVENKVAFNQQQQGGKIKYALSKIFIPYNVIKYHYPILQKHKWLTPIMEIRRWGKLIFCGHLKRTTKELKYNSTVSENSAEEMRTMLKNIGL